MLLDHENGLHLVGIRVRLVFGLFAANYFALGYFALAFLIANLACIGYEAKNVYVASFYLRLSFQNIEVFIKSCFSDLNSFSIIQAFGILLLLNATAHFK